MMDSFTLLLSLSLRLRLMLSFELKISHKVKSCLLFGFRDCAVVRLRPKFFDWVIHS